MTTSTPRTRRTPTPVILLIVAFLCPTEFSLYFDSLRLPPHRLVLLVLVPIALWRLMTQSRLKLQAFDWLLIAFNAWTVGIFMMHQGDHEGLVYGGSLALEGLGAYLVARVWIRDAATFEATLGAMATAIAIAALIALPETFFGQTFTHDILRNITGYDHPTAVETRLGLTRAYGSFDHPIHYGTFCAAMLSLFWFAARSKAQRRNRTVLLCSATFLGLSSAPILCLLLQGAMLAWERVTRGTSNRTGLLLTVLTGLYIGAAMVMNRSPINFIATGMTLDSWTGYYRLQIWQHGLNNVVSSPWTGIGLGEWARPWWMVSPTIDAFWLVIAMREGVPAVALLLLALALLMRAVVVKGLRHPELRIRRISRGWIMTLIALSLLGTTVHFWNVLYSFFFFIAGLAGWIADPKRNAGRAAQPAPQRRNSAPSARHAGQYRPSYANLPHRPAVAA